LIELPKSHGYELSLSGDLGISLPGLGPMPLAGPEFSADLCRIASISAIRQCLRTRRSLRPVFLYGSGSHSQPLALARLSSLR
jgi:hypothetical protein